MRLEEVLRETMAKLEAEHAQLEAQAEKVRLAIEAIRPLVPPEAIASLEASEAGPQHAKPMPRPDQERPKLKEAIPIVLGENPGGMTLPELAQNLWERGWVGGEKTPSIETVRGALLGLRRERITESDRIPNSKSHKWRLAERRPGLLEVISQSLQQARDIQGLATAGLVAPSSEGADPTLPVHFSSEGR